jgi:hypothetical protein
LCYGKTLITGCRPDLQKFRHLATKLITVPKWWSVYPDEDLSLHLEAFICLAGVLIPPAVVGLHDLAEGFSNSFRTCNPYHIQDKLFNSGRNGCSVMQEKILQVSFQVVGGTPVLYFPDVLLVLRSWPRRRIFA